MPVKFAIFCFWAMVVPAISQFPSLSSPLVHVMYVNRFLHQSLPSCSTVNTWSSLSRSQKYWSALVWFPVSKRAGSWECRKSVMLQPSPFHYHPYFYITESATCELSLCGCESGNTVKSGTYRFKYNLWLDKGTTITHVRPFLKHIIRSSKFY